MTFAYHSSCYYLFLFLDVNNSQYKDIKDEVLFLRYFSKYLYTYIMTGSKTATLLHILTDSIAGPFCIYYLVKRAETKQTNNYSV